MSRLAQRLVTILPAMTLAEAIDTTRIPRVAGLTGDRTAFVTTRPCCPPSTPSRLRDRSKGRGEMSLYTEAAVVLVKRNFGA
jgi:predicted ATPase with chaperone activity